MTILDKVNGAQPKNKHGHKKAIEQKPETNNESSDSQMLTAVETQFKNMMSEFQANAGFSVNTGEQPVDTMIEVLSGKDVVVSIAVLLSYIRYCVNHGIKKDITLKIGYNKPPSVPMNFAINEELLGEIYPGDVVEIN